MAGQGATAGAGAEFGSGYRPGRWWSVVAAVVVALFLAAAVAYQRSLGASAQVGRPAPAWELPDLEGRPQSLAAWRGRPVLLNFWTTWCQPCREEVPVLERFWRRAGHLVTVVGIDVREPLATVRQFVREMGMTYPVVRDADGKVAERYRVQGFPESWWVDADGVLRWQWKGPLTEQRLQAEQARLEAARP